MEDYLKKNHKKAQAYMLKLYCLNINYWTYIVLGVFSLVLVILLFILGCRTCWIHCQDYTPRSSQEEKGRGS